MKMTHKHTTQDLRTNSNDTILFVQKSNHTHLDNTSFFFTYPYVIFMTTKNYKTSYSIHVQPAHCISQETMVKTRDIT